MKDNLFEKKKKIYEVFEKNFPLASISELERMTNSLLVLVGGELSSLKRMIYGAVTDGNDMRITVNVPPVDEPLRTACKQILQYCEEQIID